MNNEIKIGIFILAAGQGKRIGMPKWQLLHNGKTFLEIIVEKSSRAKIDNIFCLYRQDSKPNISGIKYILNKTPENGMFSSIYYASKNISDIDGVLIWPVDHPFVDKNTVVKLIDKFTKNPKFSIKPEYEGDGGHPIILPSNILKKIKTADYSGGLRGFLNDSNTEILRLNVEDSNILRNVNTPNDL